MIIEPDAETSTTRLCRQSGTLKMNDCISVHSSRPLHDCVMTVY